MKKRIFSILLCLCMVLMLFPVTALAVNDATELQDLLGAGGMVELTKDYSIDTKLIVDKTVTLDLNGHVIKMTGADGVIRVDNNISLTLQDSNPTAAHTGDNASLPAGGVITGGNSEKGGGVFVGGGSFTMIGGTISDCSATNGGDAIAAIDNSTINANGGTIYSEVASFGQILNTSTSGCTKFYGEAKNLSTIHGSGTISGGIYYGEVSNRGTISGGIYYGKVENYGTISGGIYYDLVKNNNDGKISGNTVTFKNGESIYALEVVADGSKVVAPTEPKAPEGMTFAGWYIDKELTQKYKFGNTLSESITLYAGFEPAPVLAITVNGFQVGKTPNDCTYTFASTIPDITFSADDIKSIGWHRYAANGSYFPVTNDDAFRAGTLYRCVIDLDSNDLTEVPVVTVNGNTPDFRTFQYSAGAPVKLSIGCDLGTPAEPVLAITVNGFQVGNTPKDITFSFASTIPGITFSADDILRSSWDQCIVGEMGRDAWHTIPDDEVFQADTRYKCYIYLDNNGLMEAPAVTVNGKTPGDCEIATIDGVPHELRIGCELGTPEPILTLTVPFTATVKLGGSTAPGETTFELALIDRLGNELKYDGMYFDAVVTTDGAGSYTGTMTLTGPFQQLWNMLCEGAFVKQVDGGEEGWTYDDTVWGLLLWQGPIELATDYDDNDDTAPEYILLICPATLMTSGNGSYYVIDEENPVEEMQFTNTYTYSAPVRDTATIVIGGEKEESKPVEENPNTGAPVAANMSTLSVLVLASAVAVLKTRKR